MKPMSNLRIVGHKHRVADEIEKFRQLRLQLGRILHHVIRNVCQLLDIVGNRFMRD